MATIYPPTAKESPVNLDHIAENEITVPAAQIALALLEASIQEALEQFSAATGLDVQAIELSPVMDEGPTVYGVHCIVTL